MAPRARLLLLPLLLLRTAAAQEAPAFTTAKFENVETHRTNLCDRHRMVYLDEISLPNALAGLELSVVLTDYIDPLNQELFSLNEDGVIAPDRPRLFAQVMDELAQRAGFSWRNSFGVVPPINSETDGNRTWSDLLEWEVRTYDIAMGRWDRTSARVGNGISFPEGYIDSSVILVQSQNSNNASRNVWSFLDPFTTTLWLLIGLSLVVSGLLYYFLERLDPMSDAQDIEQHPGSAIYYSFTTFTGHNEFSPRTGAAKLMVFSMTLWALITAAAYTANLASFLVARNQPESTFRSVQEAVLVKAPICLQGGASLDEYVSETYPSATLVRRDTGKDATMSLTGGECDIALLPHSDYDTFRRDEELNSDCSLVWTGTVEKYVPSGLATAVDTGAYCTSLISHVLDFHILEMKTEKFFDRVLEEYHSRIGDQNCLADSAAAAAALDESGGEDTFSLSIEEMSGIFIVHFTISGIALLIATVKYFSVRRKTRLESVDDGCNDLELAPKERGTATTKDLSAECIKRTEYIDGKFLEPESHPRPPDVSTVFDTSPQNQSLEV